MWPIPGRARQGPSDTDGGAHTFDRLPEAGLGGLLYIRTVTDLYERLVDRLGPEQVLTGNAISDDYGHDEALTATHRLPDVVVRPRHTDEVASVIGLAAELGVPVTARGSGTGLSGACILGSGGILMSFERMDGIVEIDTENHVAVVEPGVTLDQLDAVTARTGSSTRSSRARTARASAATWRPTRAGCGR